MKAVAYQNSLPVDNPNALMDVELPEPTAQGRDLLVRVEAVSVNPVDTKVRIKMNPEPGEARVLGWDVAGVVEAVGSEVTLFKPGDQVWYAGAIDRPGCNSEFHLVDERIAAKMPQTLSYVQAAAMPLTTITAWEILFDRFRCNENSEGSLLVIGGAGGVASMMIQLAKALTRLTVIATASRPETREWVSRLGADHIVNHHSLKEELGKTGFSSINAIAALSNTGDHWSTIAEVIAPQGQICVIDDPGVLDISPLKRKSISTHWEFMYTRSLFQTDDMIEQHKLLTRVAELVDKGEIQTTLNQEFGKINAANLLKAHALLESGQSIGKIVLCGF
jgi:zinc-binding alcohol dehydrogenase family protein